MDTLALKAYAKINLYLEVGRRLSSGYHDIVSVMQSVSLSDTLFITEADGLNFQCTEPELSSSDNLVFRAACLLKNRSNTAAGVAMALVKNIPTAAGLGGGSADAAAALIGLNEFWGLKLPLSELSELALELGSDIAFCLRGGTAVVTGTGGEVQPIAKADIGPVLIVKPPGKLSSREVYETFDELGEKSAFGATDILSAIAAGNRQALMAACANDLEPAAMSLDSGIAEIKKIAAAVGAELCMVSGSGSSVVISAVGVEELNQIKTALPADTATWIVHPVADGVKICDRTGKIDFE